MDEGSFEGKAPLRVDLCVFCRGRRQDPDETVLPLHQWVEPFSEGVVAELTGTLCQNCSAALWAWEVKSSDD